MYTKPGKTLVNSLLVVILILLLGSIAFAQQNQEGPPPPPAADGFLEPDRPSPDEMEQHINDTINKLVGENVITENQAARLIDFFNEKNREFQAEKTKLDAMSPKDREAYMQQKLSTPHDFTNELQTAAALSDEQARAVAAALLSPPSAEQRLAPHLGKLVADGTITQLQADKIIDFFKQKDAERSADMEQTKNMNQAERDAYFHNKCKNPHDLVGDLKAAAGLTDNQANTVRAELFPPRNIFPRLDLQLTKLVGDGTITQRQAEKIMNFFKQKDAERRADMEKTKNMSPAERDAYFHHKFKKPHDLIRDLKNIAGLSDKQANAVCAGLLPPPGPPPAIPAPCMLQP